MNVLVAGGERSLVFGNLQRKLNENGIKIGWYASELDNKPYTGIPQACQGVILVGDMISHSLFDNVNADAQAARLPDGRKMPNACIRGRKWSLAVKVLRKHNFPVQDDSQEDDPAPPKEEEVREAASVYIVTKRKDGRHPLYDEVANFLQGHFGETLVFPHAQYNRAVSEALALVPKLGTPTTDNKEMMRNKADEAMSGLMLLIEQNPDLVKNPATLLAQAKIDFADAKSILNDRMVQEAIKESRALWRSDEQKLAYDVHNWLVRRYKLYKETGTGWVSYNDHADARHEIFGRMPGWTLCAPKARAEVYGDWAEHLEPIGPLLRDFFITLRPEGRFPDLLMAAKEGKLKAILVPGDRWYSSEAAVRLYADEYFPLNGGAPAPKPMHEEVQPMPAKPDLDLYAMAELIETGVGMKVQEAKTEVLGKVEAVVAGIMAALEGNSKVNDEAKGALKEALGHALLPLVSQVNNLSAKVQRLLEGQEVQARQMTEGFQGLMATFEGLSKSLSEIKAVAPAQPTPEQIAQRDAVGFAKTLMGAKHAEVHVTFGEKNT